MTRYLPPLLAAAVVLAGCTTLRETDPEQTARQQLLLSTAADHAASQIKPNLPAGNTIYVDTSLFGTSEDYKNLYALNSVNAALLRQGYSLTDDVDQADAILKIANGALSIDNTSKLFGIPSASVPIPLTGSLKTPELALWKSEERTGVAKLLAVFYDAKTGAPLDAGMPVYGFSHYDRSKILFYGRTRSDLIPLEGKARKEQ
ncbi:hypothetical protein T31B1_14850 [Salinisphaera sp. T31B1]